MFTSSHVTLVALPSATSEGILSPSYSGFFRTDVPSSQYSFKSLTALFKIGPSIVAAMVIVKGLLSLRREMVSRRICWGNQ
jgi:hypothetical protein